MAPPVEVLTSAVKEAREAIEVMLEKAKVVAEKDGEVLLSTPGQHLGKG